MPNSATAADDGLKTYKLTGAGWAETNDSGIKWADQLGSTLTVHIEERHSAGGKDKTSSKSLVNSSNVAIQSINVSAKATVIDTDMQAEEHTMSKSNQFLLDANGHVYASSAADNKIIADMPVISNTAFFVTQIGTLDGNVTEYSGINRPAGKPLKDTADAAATLYIKARARTAGEQGTSVTATSMPQSGDPAAAWTQSVPLLVAVLAVAGAVGAVMTAKRKA